MLAKSANLHARVDPKIKEDAERILETLGITVSRAVDIFYRQIVLRQGLPFDVKIPRIHPMDMNALSKEKLHAELEKGFSDIAAGRTQPARAAFADLRWDYGI